MSALTRIALVTLALAAPGVGAGILDTPHNLIGSPRASDDAVTAVCTFCHTPHGGGEAHPLWQRAGEASERAFRTYDSFGRSGLPEVERTGSVSLSCMSCHDGVQAHNVALRGPAQDALVARYADTGLSHPVGIPYGAWARRESSVAGGTPGVFALGSPGPAEHGAQGFRAPSSAVIDGVTVWWIETGEPGRQRGDVHLYSRLGDVDEAVPYVECSSCHDPHLERRNFLRVAGAEQDLCGSCHAM